MAPKTKPQTVSKPAPEPAEVEPSPMNPQAFFAASADLEPDDEPDDEDAWEAGVGELVTVRDAEGNITRVGLVVGEGAEPNLNHKDEYGNTKPETRQPVIAWLALEGAPSPYGLELSPLDA